MVIVSLSVNITENRQSNRHGEYSTDQVEPAQPTPLILAIRLALSRPRLRWRLIQSPGQLGLMRGLFGQHLARGIADRHDLRADQLIDDVLALALGAVQFLPVLEFSRLSSRGARVEAGKRYAFGVEPVRAIEWAWPGFFGSHRLAERLWVHLDPPTRRQALGAVPVPRRAQPGAGPRRRRDSRRAAVACLDDRGRPGVPPGCAGRVRRPRLVGA